jgi:hypothetical protein
MQIFRHWKCHKLIKMCRHLISNLITPGGTVLFQVTKIKFLKFSLYSAFRFMSTWYFIIAKEASDPSFFPSSSRGVGIEVD